MCPNGRPIAGVLVTVSDFRAPDPHWPDTHPKREASNPVTTPAGHDPTEAEPPRFLGLLRGLGFVYVLGLATMALTVPARNAMLDTLAGIATTASLHTEDPGADGTSEVSGGTYARKPITWNGAAGGTLQSAAGPVFDIPAATTVTHFGLWNAAGAFLGASPLSASETFGGVGTYTLTAATVGLT